MNEELFEKITDALVKDGYIIIEDALRPTLVSALLETAKKGTNYKSAGISKHANLHLDTSRRSDITQWLDEDANAQSEFLAFTRKLQEYLNRALYLGLHYYEAHFALYKEGAFYEKHLDSFKHSKNRVVTTVFYLNEEWDSKSGGELLIYNEDDKLLLEVQAKANTLVVFLSDKFPHEVVAAKRERYSIAGWFRVD